MHAPLVRLLAAAWLACVASSSLVVSWATRRAAHPTGCSYDAPCAVDFAITEVRRGATACLCPPRIAPPSRPDAQTQRASAYAPPIDPTASGFVLDFGDGSATSGALAVGALEPLLQLRLRVGAVVHEYAAPGAYSATLRFCCRAVDVFNNGGADVFLQVSVIVTAG